MTLEELKHRLSAQAHQSDLGLVLEVYQPTTLDAILTHIVDATQPAPKARWPWQRPTEARR